MKKGPYYLVALLIVALLLLSSCSFKRERVNSETRIMMGTVMTITLYDVKNGEAVIEGAFGLISDIEKGISANLETSYISKINERAGDEAVVVPEDIFALISKGLELSSESGGYFDPAIGALTSLWAIGSDHPHLPSSSEIEAVLPLLSTEDVVLNSAERSVFLKKEGMRLDLGGIGKGYAADRAKSYLIENGVERAIINLGGNVLVLGSRDGEGKPWRVGIMDPKNEGQSFTVEEVIDKTVVTSGPYERNFVVDGVLYHHILNPKTGYPYESELLSATIIGDDSTTADALSTAVFAGGVEEAEAIADRFRVKIILYLKDGTITELFGSED